MPKPQEREQILSSSVSLEQGGVIEGTRLRIISYPGEALPLRTRCPSNQLSSRLIQHPHKTVMKGSSGANDDILEHSWEVQGAVEGTLDVAGSKAERVEGLSKGGNEKAKELFLFFANSRSASRPPPPRSSHPLHCTQDEEYSQGHLSPQAAQCS